MIPDDFNRIAIDAADAVRQRMGICEIGVRRLHTGDGTWCVVFGQQPLCGDFVGMVNAICDQIKAEGGTCVAIGTDASRSTWAILARLPQMFHFGSFRVWFYGALAGRTHHTAEQIKRLAAGPGESAVLNAQDVFTTIAARAGDIVRTLEPHRSNHV